jgi:REP element-mobilizing transposase RayT
MDKYQGIYRVPSARVEWQRYDEAGKYFLTICANNHRHFFGEISNGVMVLSEAGRIIEQEWNKSFLLRKELRADEFVIMPNHLHAIVEIYGDAANPVQGETEKKHGVACRTPKSVSSFVAGFKSAVSKQVKTLPGYEGVQFWQDRFYDRIIRNETEYLLTKEYIRNNVANWGKEKETLLPNGMNIL